MRVPFPIGPKIESHPNEDMLTEAAVTQAKQFATTVRLQSNPCYAARVRVLPVPDMLPNSKYRLQDEWRLFFMLLQMLFREEFLLLQTNRGRFKPELFATILAGFLPRSHRPKIVAYGDFFQPSGKLRGKIERIVMRLADRATGAYVLLTEAEREIFVPTWSVSKEKIYVCPYFINKERHAAATHPEVDRHIFAGGNSFRNYAPLLAAARQLPDYQFVFCTGSLSGHSGIPQNVRTGLVSHQEYVHLINSAAAVIIPLQTGLKRIAGLQTCFDSMWLKKPTIIPDALGIDEYVTDGETALIVDGSPGSYREAITWIMDPDHETAVATMCENAHHTIEQYTLEKHVHHLLAVMDTIMNDD